jgi:hypothetical protein
MIGHGAIRRLLYDYVTDALSPEERERVREHLLTCRKCSDHLVRMETAMRMVTKSRRRPSEERGPEYWASFSNTVLARVSRPRHIRVRAVVGEFVDVYLLAVRPAVATAGVALIAIVIISFFVRPQRADIPAPSLTHAVIAADSAAQRPVNFGHYIRRSRALFVGFENMPHSDEHPLDLQAERRASRQLLQEARALQQQPLDAHTAHLVGDMEKVLREIANTDNQGGAPTIQLVREGIRRDNLMFKMRMAEAAYVRTVSAGRETP